MKISHTPIEGLILFEPRIFKDERGLFFESFNEKEIEMILPGINFVQDNQSVSKKNVVRGLHFQKAPHQQGKLVRVSRGSVLDVVVDLRKESITFGRHYAIELNDENNLLLWIPPGFAHGFSVLEDNSVFLYKVSDYYQPQSESGIVYNDIDLNIDWKISNPIVSSKDRILPAFKEYRMAYAGE